MQNCAQKSFKTKTATHSLFGASADGAAGAAGGAGAAATPFETFFLKFDFFLN